MYFVDFSPDSYQDMTVSVPGDKLQEGIVAFFIVLMRFFKTGRMFERYRYFVYIGLLINLSLINVV